MSADTSSKAPIRLRGHFEAPSSNAFHPVGLNPHIAPEVSSRAAYNEDEEEHATTGPLFLQPWLPQLKTFTTVVKFTITEDDPALKPYRVNINATALKEAWKGTNQESLCKMRFENALVKRILIANKSTESNFNAALKLFDKEGRLLYHPVPTFDCEEDDGHTELSGIPLWGDQVGAREVFHNPEPPTQVQMAYANFNIEDLERRGRGERRILRLLRAICAIITRFAVYPEFDTRVPRGFSRFNVTSPVGSAIKYCFILDDVEKYDASQNQSSTRVTRSRPFHARRDAPQLRSTEQRRKRSSWWEGDVSKDGNYARPERTLCEIFRVGAHAAK